MKKQFIFIPIIIAVAAFGAMKILQTKPPAPKGEAAEEKEKGEAGEEHEAPKVKLTAEARKNAGLKIEEAEPAKVQTLLPLYGKLAANEETLAHVQPRFPGVVKEVRKRLGDRVEKGEVLAVVESNDSLRAYDIKSEVAGTVIERKISLGAFVKNEDNIFTIADLGTVWVDLSVFQQDFERLQIGQAAAIHPGNQAETIESKIAYISPFGAEGTQTMLARCVLPNAKGRLRPGLFVIAEVATGETDAPVTVKLAALQTWKEKPVVFVEDGDVFAAREVELGTRDSERVEILSGLLPGDKYVSDHSFILKAELGKGEAADND